MKHGLSLERVQSREREAIIFKYTVERVLDGTQTQTRRPIRQRKRYTYTVGTTYAVQAASGKGGGARLEVLHVREQLLGAVTEADARAEGYENLAAFRHAWTEQYGGFNPAEDVWMVEFRLVENGRTEPAQPSARSSRSKDYGT